jgi:predicted HD phosphohydrolase
LYGRGDESVKDKEHHGRRYSILYVMRRTIHHRRHREHGGAQRIYLKFQILNFFSVQPLCPLCLRWLIHAAHPSRMTKPDAARTAPRAEKFAAVRNSNKSARTTMRAEDYFIDLTLPKR